MLTQIEAQASLSRKEDIVTTTRGKTNAQQMEVACKEYDTKTLGQRHKRRSGVQQQIKDMRKERINYDQRRFRWISINRPPYRFKRPQQHQQFAEQACKQDLRFVYHGARRSRKMKTTSDLGDSAMKSQTSEC